MDAPRHSGMVPALSGTFRHNKKGPIIGSVLWIGSFFENGGRIFKIIPVWFRHIAARFRHTEEQHTHFLYDNWQLAGRVNRDVNQSSTVNVTTKGCVIVCPIN